MEKQITVELNGVKYLVIELPVPYQFKDKFLKIIEKHSGIIRKIEIKNRGFFSTGYMMFEILIPEDELSEFYNDKEVM